MEVGVQRGRGASRRVRRAAQWIFGLLLLGVLTAVLRNQLGDVCLLADLRAVTIAALLILPALSLALMGYAQELLLGAVGVSLSWTEVVGLQALQRLGNVFLPGGGVAARAAYLRRRFDLSWSLITSLVLGATVVFLFGLGAVLILGLTGLYLSEGLFEVRLFALGSAVVGATLAVMLFPVRLSVPAAGLSRFLAELVNGWHFLAKKRRLLAQVALLRMALVVPLCLVYALCLHDMGCEVNLAAIVSLVATVQIFTWLPISPAAIGIAEGVIVLTATMLNIDAGKAFALAVALQASQVTAAIVLFTPLALRMKARIRRRQDEPAAPIASQTAWEAALPRSEAGDGRPKAALLETTPDGSPGAGSNAVFSAEEVLAVDSQPDSDHARDDHRTR